MISNKMLDALNKQIVLEGYASMLYLSMAAWCDKEGMEGCKEFMYRQSNEEREHMLRIYHYLSEVDAHAKTPSFEQPPHEFKSIQEMFKMVYAHEQKVTRSIYELMELARNEKDFSAINFLQWYIDEQREEEDLMRSILDKIRLIGDGGQSLYYIDKEIANLNTTIVSTEEA